MKLNLSRLILATGRSLGIISFASVAEAGIELNSSSLKGQLSEQPQQLQSLKKLSGNSSKLTGQTSRQNLIQKIQGIETSP